jgi:hypothetical protein
MDYESKLLQEINEDRQAHGKKPFADKEDDDADPPTKEVQQSTSDPESGLFHKGEHKKDFAYVTQTACDQNGRVPGYTIHPGNEHDSRTFPAIYERLKKYDPALMVLDAGYKTPAIAKTLPDDGIKPVYPYRRPMTKKGFFKKHEYVYLCPNNQVLCYATTNREGYREYKSDPSFCVNCPYLSQCTESKSRQKNSHETYWGTVP